MEYNTVSLERWRVNLRQAISKHLIDARVEVIEGFAGGIEARLKGFIWAEPLQHVEIKYPATWQDAWKEKHLNKRRPCSITDYDPRYWVAFGWHGRMRLRIKQLLLMRLWTISQWVLKRRPIQYKTHIIDIKAVFPELRLAMPEEPYVIRYTEETHG